MKFKEGDLVMINPSWDKSKGDYGISTWKKYLGKVFEVGEIGEESVILQNSAFIWPTYMLMSADKSSIAYLLWERNNENHCW